jgi:hypothetical protein
MMTVTDVLKSQYRAALQMLALAVEACPEALWTAPAAGEPFWQVAYHALFYTHLYLQDTEADFEPWALQRGQGQFLGQVPWPPHDPPKLAEPYSQAEVLAYRNVCLRQVDERLDAVDLDAASGFDWLPFSKLELQIYNIRHIQQHAGELMGRLGSEAGLEVSWVGMG